MSQMIALGQPVHVNCACCGKHAWQVSVLPGVQKLICPRCDHQTNIVFYTDGCSDGTRQFRMDVKPSNWI